MSNSLEIFLTCGESHFLIRWRYSNCAPVLWNVMEFHKCLTSHGYWIMDGGVSIFEPRFSKFDFRVTIFEHVVGPVMVYSVVG